MKEKWNNFKNNDIKIFENMKRLEYKSLFNNEFDDDLTGKPQRIKNNNNSTIVNLTKNSISNNMSKTKDSKNINEIGLEDIFY